MICEPPGEPTVASSCPEALSNTSVGAIELRGRLPGCTRFATGSPSACGTKEKSVSWLFSRKPRTITRAPNTSSIVVVIDNALPKPSTTEMCEVEVFGGDKSGAKAVVVPGGTPGLAVPMLRSPISWARCLR